MAAHGRSRTWLPAHGLKTKRRELAELKPSIHYASHRRWLRILARARLRGALLLDALAVGAASLKPDCRVVTARI
jgi:hypothetical protein